MKRCLGCMEIYEDEYDICPYCGFEDGTEAEEKIHMDPGTILADRYIIGRVLGYGGFGVTYIGWDGKLEQKVAIKEYLPSEFSTRMPGQSRVTVFNGEKSEQYYEGLKKFVDEAKRLAKFQNEPGIVKVFDSFIENETAYIIMEYLDGETLSSLIKREGCIPEDTAVDMLMPVLNSLRVVHEEGIIHRDIAPDNIIITNSGDIKLIDFGASRYATTSHSRSLTVIIKPGYSPEEQYRSRGDQGPYTDVYALGACLYKMITGKTPPDAMERRALFESRNKDILISPGSITRGLSAVRENAILNAMNVRVEDRTPNVQDFIDELSSDVPVKRKNGRIRKIDVYKWPLWFKILASAIVIALLSFGALMATGVIKFDSLFSETVAIPDGKVSVPNVEGMEYARAMKLAEKSGLFGSVGESIRSDYVEAGKIVRQEPSSGLIADENSILHLYMSSGNGEILKPVDGIATVPFIVGHTEEIALEELCEAGLASPNIAYEYDENILEGLVVSQSKQYLDRVEEQTIISIVISKGPEPFPMPDMYMANAADIQSKLISRGIQINYTYTETPDYAEGRVLSQGTPAGESIKKFDIINLEVAKSVWSDWSLDPPDESKTVEKKTQYSYSTLMTETQLDNSKRDGWEKVSSRIVYGDYGKWSSLSTEMPEEKEHRKIEPVTQYRTKQYTTANTTKLKGYELVSQEPIGYGEWDKNWKEGTTTKISDSDTLMVDPRVQYRYQTLMEKDTSDANLSNGWVKKSESVSYGNWGATQKSDTKPTEGEGLQIVSVEYLYTHYDIKGGRIQNANGWYCYQHNETGTGVYHELRRNSPITSVGNAGYGDYYVGDECPYRFVSWWLSSTTYSYQTRTVSRTYHYEKWSGWSAWQYDKVTANDKTVVDTPRTIYWYKERLPIYKFWKWSDWTTEKLKDYDDFRTVYRYADQKEQVEYTFQKWSEYTDFSDEEIHESDTVHVNYQTLYKYKTED